MTGTDPSTQTKIRSNPPWCVMMYFTRYGVHSLLVSKGYIASSVLSQKCAMCYLIWRSNRLWMFKFKPYIHRPTKICILLTFQKSNADTKQGILNVAELVPFRAELILWRIRMNISSIDSHIILGDFKSINWPFFRVHGILSCRKLWVVVSSVAVTPQTKCIPRPATLPDVV